MAITTGTLFLISKERPIIPLLYVFSIVIAICVFHYWVEFSETDSSYFLGRYSDDWQYDVLWSAGYSNKYGLNPLYITEHLNSIEPGLGALHNSRGYVYIIAVLRFFSGFVDGYHTLIARVFNLYLLSLTAVILFRTLERCYNFRVGLFHVILFLLFPTLVLNSAHVFRDTVVMFLLVIAFSSVAHRKCLKVSFFRFFVSISFVVFMLLTLRVSTVPILIFCVVVSFSRVSVKFALVGVFAFLIVFPVIYINISSELYRLFSSYSELNVKRFDGFAQSIFALPLYLGLVPRLLYSFFIPTPNFANVYQSISSVAAFLQVFSAPGLLRGVVSKRVSIEVKVFFLVIFCSVLVSTMTFRHALMYLPFGIALWIIGYQKKVFSIGWRYLSEVFVFVVISALVFSAVYIV